MIKRLVGFASAKLSAFNKRRRRAWLERLVERGLHIGRNVVIMDDVSFDSTYPWLIRVEDGCRISTGVRILAHDATTLRDLGVSRLGQVKILKDSFIAERCIILPGVTIGPRAMIAAGSVVSRDVGEGALVAGNPARVYGQYNEYLDRISEAASRSLIINVGKLAGSETQKAVRDAIANGMDVFTDGIDDDFSYFHNVSRDDVAAAAADAYARLRAPGVGG